MIFGQRDDQLEHAGSEKYEFIRRPGGPSVHFGKIQICYKKMCVCGGQLGEAKLEEPVCHTYSRVSFLKG